MKEEDPSALPHDEEFEALALEMVRKIKRSLKYTGTFGTADLLDELICKSIGREKFREMLANPKRKGYVASAIRYSIISIIRKRATTQKHSAALSEHILSQARDNDLIERLERLMLSFWVKAQLDKMNTGTHDELPTLKLTSPKQCAQAVRLHYLEDKSVKQISLTLKVSVGTAHSRIQQGLAYLALLHDRAERSEQ